MPTAQFHYNTTLREFSMWPRFVGRGDAAGDGVHLARVGQRFVGECAVRKTIEVMNLPFDTHTSAKERLVAVVDGLPVEHALNPF